MQNFYCDFEVAIILKILKSKFNIIGCFFHLIKALHQKAGKFELKKNIHVKYII